MSVEEQKKLENQFRKFKKKWFKGTEGFSGLELSLCKEAFLRDLKKKSKKKVQEKI